MKKRESIKNLIKNKSKVIRVIGGNSIMGIQDYEMILAADKKISEYLNEEYENYLYSLIKDHNKPKEIKWIRSIEKWLINIMYRFHKLKKSVTISFYKLEELWQMRMTKNK